MIFIIFPFILVFFSLISYTKSIIQNLILSLIILETLIFGSIFFSSLFNVLYFDSYRITWSIITFALLCIFFLLSINKRASYSNIIKQYLQMWKDSKRSFKIISCFFFILFFFITFISVFTIPYNYDSMTYHLARIPHWIQNKNTLPYATSINRQIYSPVLCEYTIMHTILLHGNDQFANYIQGFSYVCNVIIVFGISRKLDLSRNWSFFSAFLFSLSPMVLAQSFSTQTDEFAALWLLCFTYLVIDLFKCEHIIFDMKHVLQVAALSLCFMYGYHSKPTVCIIMFITLIALLGKALKTHDKMGDLILLLLIAVIIILLFFIPNFINNLYLYKSIFSSESYGHIVIATTDIRYYILNFYKNISYLFTTEIFPTFDNILVSIGAKLSALLGISIDDPLISATTPFRTSDAIYHQDTASYFVFITLCSITFIIFLIKLFCKKKPLTFLQKLYGVVTYSSFFILLAITKWSPWKCRYFIANSAVLIPFIVLILKYILTNQKIIGYMIITFSIIASIFYGTNTLIYHSEYLKKSLAEWDDRNEVYYWGRIDYKWPMECAIEYMKQQNLGNIGLLIGADTYEYPIWEPFNYSIRIEHIDVTDPNLHSLEDPTFVPKYILVIEDKRYSFQIGDEYIYNGTEYTCSNIFENKIQLLEIKQY